MLNFGRVEEKLIINPTQAGIKLSDIDLIVAGTKEELTGWSCKTGLKQILLNVWPQSNSKLCFPKEEIAKEIGKKTSECFFVAGKSMILLKKQ